MQISSKLFNQQQLKQFSSTTEELQDLQNKIATGENILRASDDPVGSVELSGLNVVKKQIERFPTEFPRLNITNTHNNPEDYTEEDFEILDYNPQSSLKASMVV